MKAVHDAVLAVVGDQRRLTERHSAFLAELAKHANRMPEYGAIQVVGSGLSANCYGVQLEVVCRSVAKDGRFTAIEYAFFGTLGTDRHLVYTLYLAPNGMLTSDSALSSKVCDFNNTYLAENVVSGLAAAFLKSPLVKPAA